MTAMMTTNNTLVIRPVSELERMDSQTLLNELRTATAVTASNLVYMSQIWTQLEKRGVDMTPFRNGLLRFLPMIAGGEVIPEAVIKFAGNITLLNQVAKLPLERQAALAGGEPVPVVDASTSTVRERKVEELTAREVKQVFGVNGQVRSVEQQQRLLKHAPRKALVGPKIALSERTGMISVGSQQAKLSDLLLILKQHGYTIKK